MAKLNVAFWNVQNLFETPDAERLGRGPQSAGELDAKLDRLASVIDGFFNKQGPDLLGLAEVGTRALFDKLADRLTGSFPAALRIWVDSPVPDFTGLGLIARDSKIAGTNLLGLWRPTAGARPRVLVVECALPSVATPVVVVVNHWRSRMKVQNPTQLSDAQDRQETGEWIGQRLGLSSNMQCVVMMGDFNCQPDERPMNNLQLSGVRHSTTALASRKAVTTLYNCGWRFMTEPDPWPPPPNYQASRPKTTFKDGSVIFDQLLVSKDAMNGLPLRLREQSILYHTDPRAFRYLRNGYIRPRPWQAAGNGFEGASDHLPLTATFEVH